MEISRQQTAAERPLHRRSLPTLSHPQPNPHLNTPPTQRRRLHPDQLPLQSRQGVISPLKPVYKLFCKHCKTTVCVRGMRAILLADTTVELYSTDTPPQSVQLMDKDYLTHTCHCRIRDVACRECGNIIGYHVVSPCIKCLQAYNNSHFWMFHADTCNASERKDITGRKTVLWNELPRAELDPDFVMSSIIPYDQMCR